MTITIEVTNVPNEKVKAKSIDPVFPDFTKDASLVIGYSVDYENEMSLSTIKASKKCFLKLLVDGKNEKKITDLCGTLGIKILKIEK
jgi:hypothetical protein